MKRHHSLSGCAHVKVHVGGGPCQRHSRKGKAGQGQVSWAGHWKMIKINLERYAACFYDSGLAWGKPSWWQKWWVEACMVQELWVWKFLKRIRPPPCLSGVPRDDRYIHCPCSINCDFRGMKREYGLRTHWVLFMEHLPGLHPCLRMSFANTQEPKDWTSQHPAYMAFEWDFFFHGAKNLLWETKASPCTAHVIGWAPHWFIEEHSETEKRMFHDFWSNC